MLFSCNYFSDVWFWYYTMSHLNIKWNVYFYSTVFFTYILHVALTKLSIFTYRSLPQPHIHKALLIALILFFLNLGCNSHTVNFTTLKYKLHWLFSVFTKFCHYHHYLISGHFCRYQKKNSLVVIPHCTLPLAPRKTMIYFLTL